MNPYKSKIDDFPNRILRFDSFSEDKAKLRELCQDKELCVEIGSGSGAHLLGLATRYPDKLCIGFEILYKRAYRTIEKAIQHGLDNIIVLRTEGQLIEELFETGQIEQLYILFPDPWAKIRWQKNRILSPGTLDAASRLLGSNGKFIVKTDHQEYFDWFLSHVSNQTFFEINKMSRDLHKSEFIEENIETEFEGLFLSQNLPIYMCELGAAASK